MELDNYFTVQLLSLLANKIILKVKKTDTLNQLKANKYIHL